MPLLLSIFQCLFTFLSLTVWFSGSLLIWFFFTLCATWITSCKIWLQQMVSCLDWATSLSNTVFLFPEPEQQRSWCYALSGSVSMIDQTTSQCWCLFLHPSFFDVRSRATAGRLDYWTCVMITFNAGQQGIRPPPPSGHNVIFNLDYTDVHIYCDAWKKRGKQKHIWVTQWLPHRWHGTMGIFFLITWPNSQD